MRSVGASCLAVSALAIYLIIQFFNDPVPPNPWIDGALSATSERVSQGGHYYASPDSFCPATLPYPPASLIVLHCIASGTGMDSLLASLLLGALAILLFGILTVCSSVLLGTRPSFAASAFVLVSFVMKSNIADHMYFSFVPDFVLLNCAFCILLLARSFERFSITSIVLVAILLAIGYGFKAQAISLYMGVFVFIAFRAAIPWRRKLWLAGTIGSGGLVVAAFLILVPNSWEACVVAMRHHPISLDQLKTDGLIAISNLWPFLVFPLALLVNESREKSTLAQIMAGFQLLPAPTALLACMMPWYAAIQILALMKYGGGVYNLDFVAMLGLPFMISGASKFLRRQRQLVIVFSGISILALFYLSLVSYRAISFSSQLLDSSRSYLTSKYPNAKVLYSTFDYCLIHRSSLEATTDLVTVWHYRKGGFATEPAMELVRTQHYDLVIYRDPSEGKWETPAFREFKELIRENYVPVLDDRMPFYLQGRLLGRRPQPRSN